MAESGNHLFYQTASSLTLRIFCLRRIYIKSQNLSIYLQMELQQVVMFYCFYIYYTVLVALQIQIINTKYNQHINDNVLLQIKLPFDI